MHQFQPAGLLESMQSHSRMAPCRSLVPQRSTEPACRGLHKLRAVHRDQKPSGKGFGKQAGTSPQQQQAAPKEQGITKVGLGFERRLSTLL